MRSIPVAIATLLVVLGSTIGKAQVMQLPAPAPHVTAAEADWQLRGDPVFFAGDFYYPTGPNVFFDGFVMVHSGSYQGVPLYADTSIEPYRIVYVPIGRNAMRPYERRRVGGATPPAAPVERNVAEAPRLLGTAGPTTTTPSVVGTAGVAPSGRPARLLVQSIPPPRSNAGIWLEFDGARWYSAGKAVPHVADRFIRIGTYRGLPVYRDATRRGSEIYVPSVADGPLAPYERR